MATHGGAVVLVLATALALGMGLYHGLEGLGWSDAFLNAAMLLGGMGPVAPVRTEAGKWLIGAYALFAGWVFLVMAGLLLTPVLHHVLHRLHWDDHE
jgi:hypothetical protein